MIWNHQILEFAGYEMDDGSILGDPASAELTKAIFALGWKSPNPRSRWDLLPLVVMADNDVPVMVEIPSDLGRLVAIRHPRYRDAFEKLDLKWVAAPALTRLGFDIGGVQYTAAPFIGWFMDAEIGVRDLADTFRYNALPNIAKALGLLDEHVKDGVESLDDLAEYERQAILTRAQTELTYAVCWSYQQAKISMSDTLTASMKWSRYDDDFKAKTGYRLPADPYWLAPPQGSIIPLWHRGGAPNYQPKPMISRHVQDPLKAWEREKPDLFMVAQQLDIQHNEIKRPALLGRSTTNDCILPTWNEHHVRESLELVNKQPFEDPMNGLQDMTLNGTRRRCLKSSRISVSIYFCSAGTFAEKVALKLHLRLKDLCKIIPSLSVSSSVNCLNHLQLSSINPGDIVLVVASSTGQGEVPANGTHFISVCDENAEKHLAQPRRSFRYAVYGNGDSRYAATYNGAALLVDRKLCQLGGLPFIGGYHQGDTAGQSTPLQALNPWWAKLQPTIHDLATDSPKLRRTISDDVCTNGRTLPAMDFWAEAKSRFANRSKELQSAFHTAQVVNIKPPPREGYQGTYSVTLDMGAESYSDMECIQMLPVNSPARVRRALRALGVNGSSETPLPLPDKDRPTYLSFLTEYVDLEAPFQVLDFLKQLDPQCASAINEEKLKSLSSLSALEHLRTAELLPPSTDLIAVLIFSLPILHPHTYSIASSLSYTSPSTPATLRTRHQPPSQYKSRSNRLDILVKPLPHGRFSHTFLSSVPSPLSLRYRFFPSAASRLLALPPSTPLIIIATGAGFAPVRCLLQRRIASSQLSHNQSTATISLFLGLKSADLPLMSPLLNEAAASGILSSLSITPSNDEMIRVQDRLLEEGTRENVGKMMVESGAWVFVCSGVECAKGVRGAFEQVLGEGGVEGIGERWVEEVF
ncbi:MAG: hypothetical protein Q9218_008039 [Villophora microphyllina]